MKTQYFEGSFTNFQGKEQKFIVAAVVVDNGTLAFTANELDEILVRLNNGECPNCVFETHKVDSMPLFKSIQFGVSFCNPQDTYNKELGQKIAEGKAKCDRTRIGEIHLTSGMFITWDYIEMCLKRLGECIAKSPEKYSKRYAKDLASYIPNK